MITSIILLIISFVFQAFITFLPTFSVWPSDVLDGFRYFFSAFATLDWAIDIVALFSCITFFIYFFGLILIVAISKKFINWVRGSGSI